MKIESVCPSMPSFNQGRWNLWKFLTDTRRTLPGFYLFIIGGRSTDSRRFWHLLLPGRDQNKTKWELKMTNMIICSKVRTNNQAYGCICPPKYITFASSFPFIAYLGFSVVPDVCQFTGHKVKSVSICQNNYQWTSLFHCRMCSESLQHTKCLVWYWPC